jgi:perosamine synthetase
MKKRKTFLPFALPDLANEEIKEVVKTLKSGWLTTGPKTKLFEQKFAKYIGCKHAIAVNSCTAALHLALAAIGIKENDEVIIPTMTFAATAEVITYFKAKPVMADCDPITLLITSEEIEKRITGKTKAIIGVHYGGTPCDIDKITAVARKHKLKIIWDAAHALPTHYKNRFIGTFPDITCFSFYVTKGITTGEGGMITTNDSKSAEKMQIMSLHGISKDAWKRYSKEGSWFYEIICPGFKYNLTDIASSMGLVQLKKCDKFRNKREKIAQAYNKAFKRLKEIKIPPTTSNSANAWHLYTIQLNLEKLKINRDKFIEELSKRNIGTSVHFIPLHMHPYYRNTYNYKGTDFPNSYNAYKRIISLPIYTKMKTEDVRDVISAVEDIIIKYAKR